MKSLVGRFVPRGIVAQIITLICGMILLSFVAIFSYFSLTHRPHDKGGPAFADGRISLAISMLEASPPTERTALLDRIKTAGNDILIMPATQLPALTLERGGESTVFRPPILTLPSGVHYWIDRPGSPTNQTQHILVYARLTDGRFYSATMAIPDPPPLGLAQTSLFVLALVIIALTVWAAKALTGPLQALDRAASTHNLNDSGHYFDERGPKEVRDLARALNQMQRRILALVQERTRFLVAVSHDLRTPITRLRLRAELSGDFLQRQSTLNDLAQMEQMIEATLLFLRNGQNGEALARIDLNSLMMTIRDSYADLGTVIPLDCPTDISAMLRPSEMERAITNLIENALKYGGTASLKVRESEKTIIIDVEDDGPGIPVDQREGLLQPFSRGDKARTMSAKTGFGLGLSICKAICEGHGGTLTLQDRKPKGLCARITLPHVTKA